MGFLDRLEKIDNYFRGEDEQGRFSINTFLVFGCAVASLVAGLVDVGVGLPDSPNLPRLHFPSMGYQPPELDDYYVSENFGG